MSDETLYESVEKLRDWARAEADAYARETANIIARIHAENFKRLAGKLDTLLSHPFHDPAPEPQGLDAVSGDGTWDEADERYAAAMNAPSPDGEPHIPLEVANRRLREVERERDTLREAVEEIANGEHHPPERRCAACIAKRALASLDEKEDK